MAIDEWRRKREREEEDEQSEINLYRGAIQKKPEDKTLSEAKSLEIVEQISILIEQVNHLYQMYASGAEKLPPHEKRGLLDKLMHQAQNAAIVSARGKFKLRTVIDHYSVHKERWEKMLKNIESGKLKRPLKKV